MVYRGPSTGCRQCRAKRKKCDDSRPVCGKCARSGQKCTYETPTGIVIKDVTQQIVQKHGGSRSPALDSSSPASSSSDDTVSLLYAPSRDLAVESVAFFFGKYVTPAYATDGRNHFDHLIPLFAAARPDDALYVSVSAMAMKSMCRNFGIERGQQDVLRDDLATVKAIQAALSDPETRLTNDTLIAVLCLDFAQFRTGRDDVASRAHLYGAAALLRERVERDASAVSDPVVKSVVAGLTTALMFSALWAGDGLSAKAAMTLPDVDLSGFNPSVTVHQLMVELHKVSVSSLASPIELLDPAAQSALLRRVQHLNAKIVAWPAAFPAHFAAQLARPFVKDAVSWQMQASAFVYAQWLCTRISLYRTTFAILNRVTVLEASMRSAALDTLLDETQAALDELVSYLPVLGSRPTTIANVNTTTGLGGVGGRKVSSGEDGMTPRTMRFDMIACQWAYGTIAGEGATTPGYKLRRPEALEPILAVIKG